MSGQNVPICREDNTQFQRYVPATDHYPRVPRVFGVNGAVNGADWIATGQGFCT